MPLSQEFAALLAASDELHAALANAGVPQHCWATCQDVRSRLEALALKVATFEAQKPDKAK